MFGDNSHAGNEHLNQEAAEEAFGERTRCG